MHSWPDTCSHQHSSLPSARHSCHGLFQPAVHSRHSQACAGLTNASSQGQEGHAIFLLLSQAFSLSSWMCEPLQLLVVTGGVTQKKPFHSLRGSVKRIGTSSRQEGRQNTPPLRLVLLSPPCFRRHRHAASVPPLTGDHPPHMPVRRVFSTGRPRKDLPQA